MSSIVSVSSLYIVESVVLKKLVHCIMQWSELLVTLESWLCEGNYELLMDRQE